MRLTDLTPDCADEVVSWAHDAAREPLAHYRTQMTLSLLCRAWRQRFLARWALHQPRAQQWARCVTAGYRHRVALVDQAMMCVYTPVLRLASLDAHHYALLMGATAEMQQLRDSNCELQFGLLDSGVWSQVQLRPTDMAPVRKTLQQLHHHWDLLADCERLDVLVRLLQYARASRHWEPVSATEPPSRGARYDHLYVYREPAVCDPVCCVAGRDVRGLQSLSSVAPQDALRGPLIQVKTRGMLLNGAARVQGLAHYWASRLRTMDVLRRPLLAYETTVHKRRRPRVVCLNFP